MALKKIGVSISQKSINFNNDKNLLEVFVGRQVWTLRKEMGVTIKQLAKQSGISPSMLSKIENAQTSPSFATVQSICQSLNIPVKRLFETFEDEANITFTKSGDGTTIERKGTKVGLHYQLLGKIFENDNIKFEPCLITITDNKYEFSLFKHKGVEFIYMLEGKMTYRHGKKNYTLEAGDSMCFDPNTIHGPENIIEKCKFLAVLVAYK